MQTGRENREPDPLMLKFQPRMCPYGLAGPSGEGCLGGFRFSRSQDITNQAGDGLPAQGRWTLEDSAWVSVRDVRAGGIWAGDTSLSMPQHVETYMFPLHLGVCILKFPSLYGGAAQEDFPYWG